MASSQAQAHTQGPAAGGLASSIQIIEGKEARIWGSYIIDADGYIIGEHKQKEEKEEKPKERTGNFQPEEVYNL